MLAIRLPEKLENKLCALSEETNRSKSHYVRLALEEFLEDREDYLTAVALLEQKNPQISLEELERHLGLDG